MDIEQTKLEEELSEAIDKEQLEQQGEEEEGDEKLLQEEQNEKPEMDSLKEPSNVDPKEKSSLEIKNIKSQYVSQFELMVHGQGLLLCEVYYAQKCLWMTDKGCFKLYIPMRQVHLRENEWYVYPAARMFIGKRALCMNLDLNPKLKGVFSTKDIKWEANYLHIKYRRQRRKGIVLPSGMLLGHLYIHEPWFTRDTNYITTKPMYEIKYAQ